MAKRAISVYRPPAPRRTGGPIIIAAPSSPRRSGGGRRRRSHGRRRRGGFGRGTGSTKDMVMKVALGGAAFGLLEKLGPSIPTIPVLGRAGTVAVAAYFFGGKKQGLARDICLAAATLAAYQLTKDGKVSGDDMGDLDGDD